MDILYHVLLLYGEFITVFSELNSKSYLLSGGTTINTNTDLNNMTTVGNYYCGSNSDVATLKNAPFTHAFTLKIGLATGQRYQYQEATEYDTSRKARRVYNWSISTWSDWVYFSDDATVLQAAQHVALPEVLLTSESNADNYIDNYSSSFEGNTHYFCAINLSFDHPDIDGGHIIIEGYKTNANYEWQQISKYSSQPGFIRKTRSKYNSVWGEWATP